SRIKDQIISTGKVQHAKLGIAIQDVNQGFADSFNLASPEGALIANVERGSAAERAGLKAGDVVRKVNGQRIIGSADLPALVGTSLPGDKISMDVWRDGKIVSLTATLGNAADKVADVAKNDSAAGKVKLGLALRPLQSDEKREAGISAGLLVEDAGGAAANAGVQPGDVLLSVNGRPVNTVEQVRDVVEKSAKSVALLIQRGPDKIFIPVRLG
ncbi:MAG: PDZ domain-containing protein, partial [Janthinobacterium sp.]